MTTQLIMSQNTILWKVSDTINAKTSYLVGTFHQFGNSFVDSIPEIKNSLLNSELAVFESLDTAEENITKINSREASNKVEKKLKKKDFNKLKELSKNWKVDLYKLKPIEIYWKLAQDYQKQVCQTTIPTDTFDGMDEYLKHLAETNNIKLFGLEKDQLETVIHKEFKNSNWKSEKKRISSWIKKITTDNRDSKNCDLANRYREFNLDYAFEGDCERNVIIFERNNKWMESLTTILKNKNAFVAVGYYHLRWKCGLIQQLKDLGFVVEPVKIKSKPISG